MRKIDRLRIAGEVAPAVRQGNDRRVALVNETGEVVGYRTLGEVQQQILARSKIELSVVAAHKRPTTVCRACGRLFTVKKKNRSAMYCPDGCETRCLDCGDPVWANHERYERGGIRCKACSVRASFCHMTDEQLKAKRQKQSKSLRARYAGMSAEQIAEIVAPIRKPRSRDPRCSVCDAPLPYNAMAPSCVKRRKGKPPRCSRCRALGKAAGMPSPAPAKPAR